MYEILEVCIMYEVIYFFDRLRLDLKVQRDLVYCCVMMILMEGEYLELLFMVEGLVRVNDKIVVFWVNRCYRWCYVVVMIWEVMRIQSDYRFFFCRLLYLFIFGKKFFWMFLIRLSSYKFININYLFFYSEFLLLVEYFVFSFVDFFVF